MRQKQDTEILFFKYIWNFSILTTSHVLIRPRPHTRGLGLAACVILYCNPEDARTGAATWSPGRCPPSTSQSHVHYTYGHATNRVAGAQEKTTSALVSLWPAPNVAVLFVFRPHRAGAAGLLATKPTVRVRVHRSAGENRAHLLHVQFFCICMTLPKRHDGSCAGLLARRLSDKPIQKNGMVQKNVPTPIQIRWVLYCCFHPGRVSTTLCDCEWRQTAYVWSLELCSTAVYSGTGRENATLRTGTASPSCSQGRPGARPWLCSWEEAHIAIPENGTPSTTPPA